MASPNTGLASPEEALYLLNHVFMPPKLPQSDDSNLESDLDLCRRIYHASIRFAHHFLPQSQQKSWSIVSNMLEKLLQTTRVLDQDLLINNVLQLKDGDVLALHIRAQNAGLILRRLADSVTFEAFEVSMPPEAFMSVKGKLICSYPGPAVELPLDVACDRSFVAQLASFLVQMDVDRLNAEATTIKAGSKVQETRSTTHPRYISQLLIMILRGMGKEAHISRIAKRIGDDACWDNARNPWRRSSLWLVLRVAIQTTADSRETYKAFMIFFQAELLQLFLNLGLSSELLFVARAKTSRRVHKLSTPDYPRLLENVGSIGKAIERCLQERWSLEQQLQAKSPSYIPNISTLDNDATMTLLHSKAYLTKIMCPDPYQHNFAAFCPSHVSRLRDTYDFHHPETLTTAFQANPCLALADFEVLVQERLDGWVMENSQHISACQLLGSNLEHYISSTKMHYSSPEDQSMMLLTIMQLWVALDTVAVLHCPLLLSYPPDIPISVLHPLLLRKAKHIERAGVVELYLRHRYFNASVETSVFSDKLDQSSFSVRYFQMSSLLQDIKASIEKAATNTRELKCAELRKMNAEHAALTEELNGLSCTYFEINGGQRHSKDCSRCRLRSKIDRMRISVHEWPLPARQLEAGAVVFELNCPPIFAVWRTRTYQILRDIGMPQVQVQSTFKPHVLLEDYKGLATWSKAGISGRITFGSETKSFISSHYRDCPIPTDQDSICVNNGLRFTLYDNVKGERVHSSFNLNLDSYCTLTLHGDGEGLYKHLQYAVSHTTHAHNETIVNQGDCPINLSIHEYLAFSNLRCGSQLQWKNIARELRTNVLTFSREEVHTLITQAAWQIGPLSDNGSDRLWHFELGVLDFGLVLLRESIDLLCQIEANWVEGTTVKTIIYLASRLLASTLGDHDQVQQKSYTLLRKARSVTHKWMREIMLKLRGTVDDDVASELQRRACEIAATCRATFDVDAGTHLDSLLYSSEDVTVLIECAIVIHDNTPPHLGSTFLDSQKLLNRDHRLSYFLESRIKNLIRVDRSGLDSALISVWSGYYPGDGGWNLLEANSPWLTSFTALVPGQQTQQVHYNIIEGKLLVDGKPLGRLPRDIVSHSTYRRIFGQKILDVIPSDMPGMDYVSRSMVYGCQVYFALVPGSQGLVIRTRKPSGQVLELVPHEILRLDFPTLLSTETVHWMDIHCGEIEFRPLDQLWEHSSQNWRLIFSQDGPSRMVQGKTANRYLLDIRSETFRDIAARIRPLEYSEYLTAVYDVPLNTIVIELPRFRLSFFVNDRELELKNTPGMVIDDNQCTGTMIGLSGQLVFRQKDQRLAALPRSRFVLIPHGDVKFSISPEQNHVRVHIDTRTKFIRQVTWYKYEIDSDLGLLVGNVNLASRLYRIYLHSLCSHPLPDPLTGQTGTVHALQGLANAGCFSFQKLTEAEVKLLRLIGSITPRRHYYPKHLQVMQTIAWSGNLPVLSQHEMFDATVRGILQHAKSLTIFDEPKEAESHLEYKHDSNPLLMARAAQRNILFHQAGLNGDISPAPDERYQSRDSPHITHHDNDGLVALQTSQLIYAWPVGLTRPLTSNTELIDTFKSWHHMNGLVSGASLVYNREWLDLDISERWLTIYDQCRQIGPFISKKFQLIFSFAALAYSVPRTRDFIPALLAVATVGKPSFVEPPTHPSYNLADGFEPLRERVRAVVVSATYPLSSSPAGMFKREENETQKQLRDRQAKYYEDNSRRKTETVVDYLMGQLRSASPQSPFLDNGDSHWFNTNRIMTSVTEYFTSCSRNRDLYSFAVQVTTALQTNVKVSPLIGKTIHRFCFTPQLDVSGRRFDTASELDLAKLLSSRARSTLAHSYPEFGTGAPMDHQYLDQSVDTGNLEILISQFRRNSKSPLSPLYSERLEKSRRELHDQHTSKAPKQLPAMNSCLAYRDHCRSRLDEIWSSLCYALAPLTVQEAILADAGLWPHIHSCAILHLLASTAKINLAPEWAECLTSYAAAFIEYQHSQRLIFYALRSESDNFFKELDTASYNRLDANKNPDWLLIQIQGNFVARAIQYDVAREMIHPSSGRNTVLQLNMGEGKSHVIVPLVAAALADSKKLARVVVLKPLASQMFHLLVERISGLANRRVFYLPFSRDVKMSVKRIQCIQDLFEKCASVQGVLVAQPEHILSFRLMVIDRTISSVSPLDPVARALQKTQLWLNSASRDILDESDELLHVRYQLIYTMDQQQPLDDSPDRWTTTQQVFELVRRRITHLHRDFPHEVEIQFRATRYREGEFSHVRLLGNSASRALVSQIAEDALAGALGNLNFVGLGADLQLRPALLSFIKEHDIDRQSYDTVRSIYENTIQWRGLLLLRGLLAEGILVYVLSQRRWRVDYGLDLKRSLLAVPYRAKDVPSLRSEFGHPDVTICLTCLSFYYGGLTLIQVQECFDLLFKLDNPPLEYEIWVKRGGGSIPLPIRQLIGVNTKDVQTFVSNIVPIFQQNQAVIDFFLSQVVFPRCAKEFPSKLGTSGWDLAQCKANFTTGFSGTNDNSDLLPTSITQSDPVNQLRTNAQVLGYLLQEENKTYICAQGQGGQPCSAAEFLEMMTRDFPEVRVLLDVGAQMLEMANQQLVEHWLSMKHDTAAGVFFDDADNLSVLTRDGMVEPLYSSPFFQQLDQCIVYLDDAHTRGTDLKLPLNFKAVVTLGPNVTKDRLVQGCMRMRKLGHGQSVVFCAPPEVDRRIRESENLSSSCPIRVIDLLSWVMSKTCADIEHHIPHWVQQGIDYHRRGDGDAAFSASNSGIETLKKAWLQPAAQSLEEMYGVFPVTESSNPVKDIPDMYERLRILRVTTLRNAQVEEEQEREVDHEVEQELQLERPPSVPSAAHCLDEDVRRLVLKGTVPNNSGAFFPLMTSLRFGSDTLKPENPWSGQLLATRDFITTTKAGKETSVLTDFLRSVNWIVSGALRNGTRVLVVMSPFEVNALLQDIRMSSSVRLHMYAPRTTQSMKPFDDLVFYCVPPLACDGNMLPSLSLDMQCQINIWSGQLYIDRYETYLRLCLLLGISSSEIAGHRLVEHDRFVPESGRIGEMVGVCLFRESPLPLLKVLFGLRRKGMSYRSTHMGKILHARLLTHEDFEDFDMDIGD